ncbi:hypothetical protein VEE38_27840 [Escherichia coli]|nr:hypothetical protein FORC81_2334 [Escherichia coli]CUU94186.1 hypothetical protein HMVEC_40033 [Escherichia coli]BDD34851.1 hypothetical protein VEGS20_A34770 [Escherichia coli]BEB26180.1 hypothetical protein VEE38_27840 [Escherichia coli]BEB83112.1 hypothetical protein VEE24_34690 [Escherichia coli]
MNVTDPKYILIVCAESFVQLAGNSGCMVTLASIHATAHTGAAGVGVFAENSVEPRSS